MDSVEGFRDPTFGTNSNFLEKTKPLVIKY